MSVALNLPALGLLPEYGAFVKADITSVAFTKTAAGTASLKAGTIIDVAGVLLNFPAATNIVMPTLNAGINYYIYACADGTVRADSSIAYPTGYTSANSRNIGGFYYQPAGNAAAQISLPSLYDISINTSNYAIAQSLHYGTIVASQVYDTSKDSDGGAWRQKQATKSWYNETLCTGTWRGQQTNEAACRLITGATTGDFYQNLTDGLYYTLSADSGQTQVYRGNTQTFPALVGVVAEAKRVVLYDMTAPGCPMWRVSIAGSTLPLWTGTNITGVAMFNGTLYVTAATLGLVSFSFPSDFVIGRRGNTTGFSYCSIANSNVESAQISIAGYFTAGLVSADANAVAVTVLPDAPIDPLTGLPAPTIAVATVGGISVIKQDGTVVNSSTTASVASVSTTNGVLWANNSASGLYMQFAELSGIAASFALTAITTPQTRWPNGGTTAGLLTSRRNFAQKSSDAGLVLLQFNKATPASSSLAYITKDYNSGWMVGDIKRCWLSDTVAGSATGTIADRSVKNSPATITGTLTKTAVASGSSLVAYSGWSASNYAQEAYSADLDFGTGDFCVVVWAKPSSIGSLQTIFDRSEVTSTNPRWRVSMLASGYMDLTCVSTGGVFTVTSTGSTLSTTAYTLGVLLKRGTVLESWVNNILVSSVSCAGMTTLSNALANAAVGVNAVDHTTVFTGSIALLRIGATAPTSDQIDYIYRTELPLFQANAQCVLAGSSNVINALAYDDGTNTLHVGTSYGRSSFVDLIRTESEATVVGTPVSISATNGVLITGGTNAQTYQPALLLRDELKRKAEAAKALGQVPVFFEFDATLAQVAFTVQQGYTVKAVYSAGVLKRIGSTKDYLVNTDGFRETVTFAVAPGATVWVSIMTVRA